jgi:SAM-dependent methyltransferase
MDASEWDARYSAAAENLVWSAEPNRFVAAELAGMAPGRALDLGCGEGRNAVWLAARGWQVTGVDFSAAGLDKARDLAIKRGVDSKVAWVCADVTEWGPPRGGFELVLLAYLQLHAPARRNVVRRAVKAVADGGTLLVVAHDARNLAEGTGGPQDPAALYGAADLCADIAAVGDAGIYVDKAETVARPVEGSARPALDVVFRARRRGTD